jgi:hypothetical protein
MCLVSVINLAIARCNSDKAQYSDTPVTPTLRSQGIEDEDDDEDEAPGEGDSFLATTLRRYPVENSSRRIQSYRRHHRPYGER